MRRWTAVVVVVGAVAVLGGAGVWGVRRVRVWMAARAPEAITSHPIPLPPPGRELEWVGAEGVDPYGYPTRTVSRVGLLALLKNRRFADLTHHIEELLRESVGTASKEYWLTDAIFAFDGPDPTLTPLLDAWVAASPQSFAPYAARAEHLSSIGWRSRGTAFARETSAEKFALLTRYLDLARVDAARAIELEPRALSPYLTLVRDAKHGGDPTREFERAAAKFPASFRLYYAYVYSQLPKWGGSMARIQAAVRSAQAHVGENPKLAALKGFPHWAIADEQIDARDYAGALAAAQKAVVAGEHYTFIKEVGDAKRLLNDYAGALVEYDRVLALRPDEDDVLRERAWVCAKLGRMEEAGESFLQAQRLDPTEWLSDLAYYAWALTDAGGDHFRAGRLDSALRDFDDALLLSADQPIARRARSAIAGRGSPKSEAVDQAMDRSRARDDVETMLALDGALASRGRFAEVVEQWSRFIERHPTEARAYLERGGAFTHIGMMREANLDSERACDLGSREGCAYRDRFRAMTKR